MRRRVEQVGDLHTGIAIDEMQHPMVRPAEVEFLQHVVGIGHEVPVGKEQKLDQVPDRLALGGRGRGPLRRRNAGLRGKNYVSHVDIFLFDCYSTSHANEMIVRGSPVAI
jgi:hypothetical protein